MTIYENVVSPSRAEIGDGERGAKLWSKPAIEDVSVSEHTEIASSPGTDSSATLTTLS
jgi:hypothetical protein